MKKILKVVGSLLFIVPSLTFGGQPGDDNSNYVVIGAFASHENAVHFVEIAKKASFDAQFEMNPNRQLYYVYVLHTGNKKLAFQEAQKIRNNADFHDTWVFTGVLGQNISSGKDIDPQTGGDITPVAINTKPTETIKPAEVVKEPAVTTPAEVKETPVTEKVTTPPVTETTYPKTEEAEGNGRHYVFKIFKTSNKQPLEGEADIIDLEKKKKVSAYQGNKDVIVRPVGKTGEIGVECEVFGYRKVKYILNFNSPQNTEGVVVENDQAIVPFEMVRLRKGDFAVMYNVLFYKDAAIMKPESRYEVNSLLEMMQENPKYKIRIHGHTNGNAPGNLIEANDPKNFFSLSNTKEGLGTAKQLSEARANLIKNYLVAEGIDPMRLEVKSWGGKKPILDKNHPQAHTNVRVEIEIIEE